MISHLRRLILLALGALAILAERISVALAVNVEIGSSDAGTGADNGDCGGGDGGGGDGGGD